MATIDEDTLKTLQRIEKQLAAAFPGGRQPQFQQSQTAKRNEQNDAGKEARGAKQVIMATVSSLDRFGRQADSSADALSGFRRQTRNASGQLEGFSGTLGKTITSIGLARSEFAKISIGSSMNDLMKSVEQASATLQNVKAKSIDTTGIQTSLGSLERLIDNRINPGLGTFGSALSLSTRSLLGVWSNLKEAADQNIDVDSIGNKVKALGQAFEGAAGGGGLKQQIIRSTRLFRELNKELRTGQGSSRSKPPSQLPVALGAGGGGGGSGGSRRRKSGSDDDGGKSKIFGREVSSQTRGLFDQLKTIGGTVLRASYEVIDDMFQVVAARGYGAAGSLFELYGHSIMAGMSLREYAKVLDENNGAVSRSKSLDDFNKSLDIGRKELMKFGVFGMEATELAAAMNNSATLLGVPQEQLADATRQQISVFEQLRKTSGLTAEAFTQLQKEIQDSEVVQRELIGLAPAERAARKAQLMQTMTWGRQLGLSEQAQRQLTQALIDQRKTTVKDRFQSRGRITQAFALAGMSADEGNEARNLASKRMKTPEEERRLTELLGQYNQRAEAAKQSGNDGLANQFETMDAELRKTTIGPLLDASASVNLAQSSGPQQNVDQGQVLSEINQKIGSLITIIEGIAKNPLGAAVVAGIAAIGAYFIGRGFATIIGSRIGTVVAGALGGAGGAAGGLGGAAGRGGRGGRPGAVGAPTPTGMGGIGGLAAEGAAAAASGGGIKGKAGSLARGAGKGFGKALPYVGALVGAAMTISDFNNAEETAKVENGGDGDVGKAKGEAIGEGIGAAAGAGIGAAIGSVVPVFGTLLGGWLGSIVGGWGGKLIGGLIGAESATEKQSRETKKNTDELVKARRATADASEISSSNLSALTANVQKTAAAFQAPSQTELKAYADSKLTPEQRKARDERDKADAIENALPTITENTYDALGNITGTEEVKDRSKAAIAAATAKVTAAMAAPTPVAPVVVSTAAPATSVAGPSTAVVAKQAAATAAAITPLVATPTSTDRQAIVSPTVNSSSDQTAQADARTASISLPVAQPAIQSADAILAQVLAVLQQSLSVETTQVDLFSQLIRNTSGSRLPDNQVLGKQVLRS